jgi:chemotaxis signal transduction protein
MFGHKMLMSTTVAGDVQSFAATSIKPAPDMGVVKARKSLLGIATAERGMVLLLDLDGLNTAGLSSAIAA